MKKVKDEIIFWIVIIYIIVANVIGIWWLQVGDLSDLLKGCYDSDGCQEVKIKE